MKVPALVLVTGVVLLVAALVSSSWVGSFTMAMAGLMALMAGALTLD